MLLSAFPRKGTLPSEVTAGAMSRILDDHISHCGSDCHEPLSPGLSLDRQNRGMDKKKRWFSAERHSGRTEG